MQLLPSTRLLRLRHPLQCGVGLILYQITKAKSAQEEKFVLLLPNVDQATLASGAVCNFTCNTGYTFKHRAP